MKTWEKMTAPRKRRRRRVNWGLVGAVSIAVVAVAFFTFAVAFKIANHLDAGTLTDKRHQNAYTTHSITYIKSGKSRIPLRHNHHHPESWWFVVEYDGKRDIWEVSEDQYNSAEVGDWVERR